MYKIIAEWTSGESEVVDEAGDKEDAVYLVGEYRMAFAAGEKYSQCARVFYAEE